jgi:hypothetical protein
MFYWTEELYSYTKIYDSLSPLSRICIDLRIQGRKPAYISGYTNKPLKTVKQALWRAKKRYLSAILNNKSTNIEKVYISNSEEPNCYEVL